MSEQIVTRYVTKWALTKGIWKLEGHLFQGKPGETVYFSAKGPGYSVFVGPNDYHETLEQAQARVGQLARDKLNSLSKQAAKIAKLLEKGAKVVE